MIFYENPDFIKNLDIWLDISDQNSAKWLSSINANIPQMFKSYSGTLYRGFIISEIPNKPFEIKTYTSWSKDKNMAMAFLKDSKYRISKKEGIPVLASKQITTSKQILDIHSLAIFLGVNRMIDLGIEDLAADSAMKEKEILINKGIKVLLKELTIV